MSVIAFDTRFYCTATALLIEDFNFHQNKNHEEYKIEGIRLVNELIESNWGAYADRYDENMSERIHELNKLLISIVSGSGFMQYLESHRLDRFLKELSMFDYNSDQNPRIYKILYTLYIAALRKKEFWENSKK
nr:hypothetical protein GTC16762_32380 [Pigmentibacter ruber]